MKLTQRTRAAESARQYLSKNVTAQEHNVTKPILPYDYFHTEVAQRLVERLDDIRGDFPLALEVGASADFVHDAIIDGYDDDLMMELDSDEAEFAGGRGGVRKLVQIDPCSVMLHRDNVSAETKKKDSNGIITCETYKMMADIDEAPLPFPDGTFNLVISSMALHWINDLPRLLSEMKRVLKPDGCLLFALPGGNTLPELRSTLVLSELERTGGVSTHVGPYIDLSNIGSLLAGAGFQLPTIDIDEIQVQYPNAMVLMEHLARMGEGNACVNRKDRVGLGTFVGAACLYKELYPADDGNEDQGIVASAQVIYGIAWKQHDSQPKPLVRGSATSNMADIAITKSSNSEA